MSNKRFEPDYDTPCDCCGATPTVMAINESGEMEAHFEMCGPCTFGEAAMLDPEEWNK